jgi:hypothetical protein
MFHDRSREMQPFRAALTDDAGQAIADIEGSIQSVAEAQGVRRGNFEFPESESFMQGVLEEKTFRIELDDGSRLDIHVDAVSGGAGPGRSRVEFSSSRT